MALVKDKTQRLFESRLTLHFQQSISLRCRIIANIYIACESTDLWSFHSSFWQLCRDFYGNISRFL